MRIKPWGSFSPSLPTPTPHSSLYCPRSRDNRSFAANCASIGGVGTGSCGTYENAYNEIDLSARGKRTRPYMMRVKVKRFASERHFLASRRYPSILFVERTTPSRATVTVTSGWLPCKADTRSGNRWVTRKLYPVHFTSRVDRYRRPARYNFTWPVRFLLVMFVCNNTSDR